MIFPFPQVGYVSSLENKFPGPQKNHQKTTGWWLNQPIWKILVKMGIFPKFRGENKTYLSCHHLDKHFDAAKGAKTSHLHILRPFQVWIPGRM